MRMRGRCRSGEHFNEQGRVVAFTSSHLCSMKVVYNLSHRLSDIRNLYIRSFLPAPNLSPKSILLRPFSSCHTAKMRLPYIPDDPQMESKEDQDVVDRVKERRGGKLIALDKALLHARKLNIHHSIVPLSH